MYYYSLRVIFYIALELVRQQSYLRALRIEIVRLNVKLNVKSV